MTSPTVIPAAVRILLEPYVTSRGMEQLLAAWRGEGAQTVDELTLRATRWVIDADQDKAQYYR